MIKRSVFEILVIFFLTMLFSSYALAKTEFINIPDQKIGINKHAVIDLKEHFILTGHTFEIAPDLHELFDYILIDGEVVLLASNGEDGEAEFTVTATRADDLSKVSNNFKVIVSKDTNTDLQVLLNDHEPNLVGLAYDSDDNESYLDFKLSLEYPFFADQKWSWQPYFSFTGRFGQYLLTRPSSPVIAKRFNPKLFIRKKYEKMYVDYEYAHESNGQSVASEESYNSLKEHLTNEVVRGRSGKEYYVNDYIDRGWDYWGITAIYNDTNRKSHHFHLSRFVDGILQDGIDEYYPEFEESRKITKRSEVHGIKYMFKYQAKQNGCNCLLHGYKLAFTYETGYRDAFENNSLGLELTVEPWGLPIMFSIKEGYVGDLAQYYKDLRIFTIGLELTTF